jgi:SAM-dependent methyltransferase
VDVRHWLTLRRLEAGRSADYRGYLHTQLARTLSKRENDPGVGARLLIDRAVRALPRRAGASVLCIGCRNSVELDEFTRHGLARVVGIDLFSQRRDILIMDMHSLLFTDDSFDVVYSSHSLEHAYELQTVVGEIVRVARDGAVVAVEVPVGSRSSSADRLLFSGIDTLRQAFGPCIREELLAEQQPPLTESNGQGTEIARLVFRLRKDAAPARQPAITPGRRRRRLAPRPVPRFALITGLLLVLVYIFALAPEQLGDRPYNVF